MLVPTRLLVEDQPPVVTVDMQKSAALPVIKQTFFSHVIPSFLNDQFHVVNLIPNPPKVNPVRKFQRALKPKKACHLWQAFRPRFREYKF